MNIKIFYNKEILPFINKLTKPTDSVKKLFEKQNELYSRLNEINFDFLNFSDKLYYFCIALTLHSVYRLFYFSFIDLKQSLYLLKNSSIRAGAKLALKKMKKNDGSYEKNEEEMNSINSYQTQLWIDIGKSVEELTDVSCVIRDKKLYRKSRLLVMEISKKMYDKNFNKKKVTSESLSKFDAVFAGYLKIKLLPKSFITKIMPLINFLKLYNSGKFLQTVSDYLLLNFYKSQKIKTELQPEIDYKTCTYYLNLASRYKFISDPLIKQILFLIAKQNEKTKMSALEQNLRFVKGLIGLKPDLLLQYPGFIFCLYEKLEKFDFNTLALLFDCEKYNKTHNFDYELLNNFGYNVLTSLASEAGVSQAYDEKVEMCYQKNCNQNLLCTFIYIGVLKLLAEKKDRYSEIIKQLIKGISQKKHNDFSYLIENLNNFSKQFAFNKKSPFENLSFVNQKDSAFDINEVAVNILYMLLHADSLDAIYHEINFVREQQKKVLECIANRNFTYNSKDEADDVIKRDNQNRKFLKEIDFGFNFEFLQRPDCFKISGFKYGVRRKMTCKLFSEIDKKYENFHTYQTKRNKHKIDYEEDYRITNTNRFSNYYLYLDRNAYTHHSDDFPFLDDSKPKQTFFEVLNDVLCFFDKKLDSKINEAEKIIFQKYGSLLWELIYNILCKFAPEFSFSWEESGKLFNEIFETVRDKDGNKISKLKNKYNDMASYFSLEQNLTDEEIYLLKKVLKFAFLCDTDVVSANKVSIMLYLMYMTIKLTKIQNL